MGIGVVERDLEGFRITQLEVLGEVDEVYQIVLVPIVAKRGTGGEHVPSRSDAIDVVDKGIYLMNVHRMVGWFHIRLDFRWWMI
jgi:hypothetical protein